MISAPAAAKRLARQPNTCPYCTSVDSLEGEGVDIQDDGKKAEQEVTCSECGASFYVYYRIDYVSVISEPSTEEE